MRPVLANPVEMIAQGAPRVLYTMIGSLQRIQRLSFSSRPWRTRLLLKRKQSNS